MKKLYSLFYKTYHLYYKINDSTYEVEYHRSPFWTYEKESILLFLKKKIRTWHGQVWLLLPNGGRCGFDTICEKALFPKRRMKKFLTYTATRLEKLLNEKPKKEGTEK